MVEQLVVRDAMFADVLPHTVKRPVGERIELHNAAVVAIELDLRDVATTLPLLPSKAGHPRVECGELPLQGLHLPDLAAREAKVDRPVHEVRSVLLRHALDVEALGELELDVDPIALPNLLEQCVRLGRKATGVEGEHSNSGVHAPGHVDERHPVDAARRADGHPRVERVERPRK